jgi:hypothetical protein
MELLTILNAKSIWQIETKHLNPRGRNIEKDLIEWLKNRYQFQKYPTLPIADPDKGIEFGGGTFETESPEGKKEKYYVDLTIFNDGLIANTRASTKISDQFLLQALTFASIELDLVFKTEMISKILYLSELEVRLNKPLWSLSPNLKHFADKLRKAYPSERASDPVPRSAQKTEFEFASIAFWPDPSLSRWRPSPFQIERRLNSESGDIYYSRSSHETESHLKLLEEFEEILEKTDLSIQFPKEQTYHDLLEAVVYPAIVNGKRIFCHISIEALSDHFGANLRADDLAKTMTEMFVANRPKIEEVTAKKIQTNKFEPDGTILVRSRDLKY